MRILILSIGLFFCFFPYTQILEIESYTQPYALLFCALGTLLSFDQLSRELPRRDLWLLFLLAVLGVVVFLLTCMPEPNQIDLKTLLSYLSPPVFAAAGFAMVRTAPTLAYRIAVAAASAWLFAGAMQTFVSPTFATQFVGQWEDAATVVVESGRGVLGLAPEPTHFGFHMLVLATALIILRPDRLALPALCVLGAVLLARSSSAVLAIVLGSLLYLLIYGGKARILVLAMIPGYLLLGAIIESGALPESVRVFDLLRLAYENPTLVIAVDASVNARIGGIIAGVQEILRGNLMPYGMSNDAWIESTGAILGRNRWLIDISTSGVPSGILLIVYHTGIFGLALLIGIFQRMFSDHRTRTESWFVSVLFFVFMSQYLLSTPGFGLIYGFIAARHSRFPARSRRRLAPPSSLPGGAMPGPAE